MELLSSEHIRAFRERFPLESQVGGGEEALIVLKLFHPASRYTFYVTEGSEENGDWTFYGYTISPFGPDCDEWGYTSLNELKQVDKSGLRVERDIYFPIGEKQIKAILPLHRQAEQS